MQAVIAAEVGHLSLAYDYLAEAALVDLRDLEHNTGDGLHIASLAGTWIALVGAFGGVRNAGSTLSFAPRLPDGLTRLTFAVGFRGRRLRVDVTGSSARYSVADGAPLDIMHHGERLTVAVGEVQERPIPAIAPRRAPSQPAGRAPVHRRPVADST
jgi:alpha,alpha-trehalose phosphorylase